MHAYGRKVLVPWPPLCGAEPGGVGDEHWQNSVDRVQVVVLRQNRPSSSVRFFVQHYLVTISARHFVAEMSRILQLWLVRWLASRLSIRRFKEILVLPLG